MSFARARLKDIAEAVGVGESTVSRILNRKANPIRISDATREKILRVAAEMGYQPDAAAKSLSTRRTGHIGFVLSDTVAGGLANSYFSLYLAGVEGGCRRRGYGLYVSLYNLSNVDTFVFPPHVGQRSVDGLLLAGYVEAAVVARFREFGVPCVGLGQDTEVADLIPTVASDDVGGTLDVVRYLASLGHRRILYNGSPTRRGRDVINEVIARAAVLDETRDCVITVVMPPGFCDYSAARPLFDEWMKFSRADRPTAILGTDQTMVTFLKELARAGLSCPKDVSVVSLCVTPMTELANPSITGMDQHVEQIGEMAATMLLDHLEKKVPMKAGAMASDVSCTVVVRDSCAEVGR